GRSSGRSLKNPQRNAVGWTVHEVPLMMRPQSFGLASDLECKRCLATTASESEQAEAPEETRRISAPRQWTNRPLRNLLSWPRGRSEGKLCPKCFECRSEALTVPRQSYSMAARGALPHSVSVA